MTILETLTIFLRQAFVDKGFIIKTLVLHKKAYEDLVNDLGSKIEYNDIYKESIRFPGPDRTIIITKDIE